MTGLSRELALLRRKAKSHPTDIPNHLFRTVRLVREQRRLSTSSRSAAAPYLAHFGVHLTGDNAGDVLLYDSTRKILDTKGPFRWKQFQLRNSIHRKDVDLLNENASAIVVGGGGLIFPKTRSESQSGWQWNISTDLVDALTPPLVLFGVGVNTFRGQDSFPDFAREHLAATAERSRFIGLRNRGSLRRFQELVPDSDPDIIRFQPCPTTVLGEFTRLQRASNTSPRVALNVAVDHSQFRFDDAEGELRQIATACSSISKDAQLIVVTHADNDDAIVPYLRAVGAEFEVVRLERRLPSEIVSFYTDIDLTIGMRGHAQMIPFGCGGMILSLISHDKLGFFLEDIGHEEWGVELGEGDISERILILATHLLSNSPKYEGEIRAARRVLWDLTQTNLDILGPVLSPTS